MSEITALLEMDWKNGVLFIAAVIVAFIWVIQKWEWIISKFGIITKKALAEQKQVKDIDELKSHAKKTDENIDKLIKSIDELRGCIHAVSDQVRVLQDKTDASERSKLKDRIGQGYRYYSARKKWTPMEKDAFDDLIKSYEDAGGQNSFVHTVCLPESLHWQIVDSHDDI